MTGPASKPETPTQCDPVISPLPFRLNQPAKTASLDAFPRGKMAVTPVRTGPTPTFNGPSPEMIVVYPTSTPFTSVIAFSGPGLPSNGTPRSRARGLLWPTAAMEQSSTAASRTLCIQALQGKHEVYSRGRDDTRAAERR